MVSNAIFRCITVLVCKGITFEGVTLLKAIQKISCSPQNSAVSHMLSMHCQVSNWNFRPLSTVQARCLGGHAGHRICPAEPSMKMHEMTCLQVIYAATDAHVLLRLEAALRKEQAKTLHLGSQSKECTKKALLSEFCRCCRKELGALHIVPDADGKSNQIRL